MTSFRSSGDLRADRRYEYARAALEERDGAAAVDLFRQTLELAPNWPPAHFGLGEALILSGDKEAAVAAFQKTLLLAPDDVLGSGLRLARLGFRTDKNAMTPDYVAALFDQYADRFDDHLVKALDYRGPEIIMAALASACAQQNRDFRFPTVMDLGCGTGLMARTIAPRAITIDGIDLSPAMVNAAENTGLYRGVWVGDVVDSLTQNASHYTLVLAADVLVYIGDLQPLFRKVSDSLEASGLFAFTVQSHERDGFVLGADLRYHHSESSLRTWASKAGLSVLHCTPCVTRQDAGKPVPGLVVVLEKPDGG
ncbi:MAG: methyltransferase domain-containing protein [Beijerinckiaceae bacterium]